MPLNLVFHDVCLADTPDTNRYTLTLSQFCTIADFFSEKIQDDSWHIKKIRFYFDDGYHSFIDYIYPLVSRYSKFNFICAIPADFIDQKGYMSKSELFQLFTSGVCIVPHGVSHAALAIYEHDTLMLTISEGEYINAEYGKKAVLTENQVLFQLQESKGRIEELLGNSVDEFVLPYGLYNSQTLAINTAHSLYSYISTCDEFLDCGEGLRPRVLVDKFMTLDEIADKVESLKQRG